MYMFVHMHASVSVRVYASCRKEERRVERRDLHERCNPSGKVSNSDGGAAKLLNTRVLFFVFFCVEGFALFSD